MVQYMSRVVPFVVTSFAFLTPLLNLVTSVHPSHLTFLGSILRSIALQPALRYLKT